MKNYLIFVVIVIFLLSVFQAFQISAIKSTISSNGYSKSDSGSGETYEQMMARMHPDQTRQQQTRYSTSAPQQPQMVGGC